MKRITRLSALSAGLALAAAPALAESIKVGVVMTLSGSAAVLGEQGRDGFLLALEELGGRIGGLEAEVVVVDDELKPDVAVNRARELVESHKVDVVIGAMYSNVQMAITGPLTEAGVFVLSPNPGPSALAGAGCNPNFFAVSYQNDQPDEVVGAYVSDKAARTFLIAPNYQAGKDHLTGFKRTYTGEVAEELYVPLDQMDYSAELAQIAAAAPDAVYAFMPGGLGVNFVRQYRQAGLEAIPFYSTFTVDEVTLPAQKKDAVGFYSGGDWAPDLDTDKNRAFVAAFEAKYDRVPASYAAHAYDAAYLLDAAVTAVGGDLSDKDALRRALKAADFESVRGEFAFGPNHFPLQDFYVTQVAERPDGKFQTQIVEKVLEKPVDAYAAECPMK
ncbi:ABC transporter substrate-binding protein [Cereibacter azotoformans]|uniref:ABC transporter substrate-binding protein n=1 Tax=Cereibacter azotoformans TaxID=43057 RepID=UPI001EE9B575|nr:ABC transporter substrate-binding protein [Cereibacter azotoformans]ULB11607.1 ABC transporter substrate-binding protein [Cereibacter azotoformans]